MPSRDAKEAETDAASSLEPLSSFPLVSERLSLTGLCETLQPLRGLGVAQGCRPSVPFCRDCCISRYSPGTDLHEKQWVIGFRELGRGSGVAALGGPAVEQPGGGNIADGEHRIPVPEQVGHDFGR